MSLLESLSETILVGNCEIFMRALLALVPPQEVMLSLVQVAQACFGGQTDGYLLDESKSLPHITVCAFHVEEGPAQQLWREAQSLAFQKYTVRVLGASLKPGREPPHHYSVGLALARDPALIALHQAGLDLLKKNGLQAVNPSGDLYQPHLTVAGIRWSAETPLVLPSLFDQLLHTPLPPLELVLARGDEIGQCIQILHKREP